MKVKWLPFHVDFKASLKGFALISKQLAAWIREPLTNCCFISKDMNEVANFVKGGINGCADNKLNYPPFTPSESQMHLQLDLFIADASVSSASEDIRPRHFYSTLQVSSMAWCTVRPYAWMLNTSGGTTMMSTVCMGTLWSWPLTSKCWFIHIFYANDLYYDWLMLLSSLVRMIAADG